ncbi:glycoside hydrolase family 32 protein [Natrinema sp. SYSU A 869]|uniref:glycoside hydrolase family 32 protein n=1 Tax=Natrinema sp. SYSU A 869 TaxID=2871694 RepID=UPI001CA4248A|nr:glycoside hydrolase family 32 protein [Natrinema sp. SYSU A 869]
MQAEDPKSKDSPSLGFLTAGELTDEQRAALRAAREIVAVDRVLLEDLPTERSLSSFDVLWWHRDLPFAEETFPSGAVDALMAYLDGGGGLLLSLHGVTTVEELGIDPQPPDLIDETYKPVHKWGQRPAGFLIGSRFADADLFGSCDGNRVHTQPSRSESTPRVAYERRIPKRGTVLASAAVGETDVPRENSVIGWQVGAGTVVGIGQHFTFDGIPSEYLTTLRTILRGAIKHIARGEAAMYTRPRSGAELAQVRTEIDDDPHRPSYHFTPPANWMNDPNGLIKWNGEYHLFYQYNPAGPYHGSIHWGHAVSDDLVHWEDRPVALEPDAGGPDRHGCWSGCTVLDDDIPTFVYTGGDGHNQLPCLARAADDDLDTWQKSPQNPIITDPPERPLILANGDWNAEFRDHDVWKEDGTWYHLIGSGTEDAGGTALLYQSDDLLDWGYVGPILVGDRDEDGPIWECPELLDFGDLQLLQVSNYDKVAYFLGTFDSQTFDRKDSGTLDHGNYYAAQSIPDGDGRYLSWGWIREDRSASAQWDAGWSGAMSVPRSLSLSSDGTLVVQPAEELTRLRGERETIDRQTLSPNDPSPCDGVSGDALEIQLELELDGANAFELVVACSDGGEERTLIRYTDGDRLTVNREHSSLSDAANSDPQSIDEVPQSDDGIVRLRVLVDASVIEVFVNDRTCVSSRIYPTRPDSTGVSLEAVGGAVELYSADIWSLKSAFADDSSAEAASNSEINLD